MILKQQKLWCYHCRKRTVHNYVGTDRFLFVPMYRFYQCSVCLETQKEVAR